jgi:hypothetical protein
MKKSEQLKQDAAQEDNDLKAIGMLNKSLREGRLERFEDDYLPKLVKWYDVVHQPDHHKYTIDTDTQTNKYGIIDFFPKANKVLIKRTNKWIKPGLDWINKKLL